MKYKGIFLDFYGTLVHDDDIVEDVTRRISDASKAKNSPKEIAYYWWREFSQLVENSYGTNFKKQCELETISFQHTLDKFQCTNVDFNVDDTLVSYWGKPEIYADTVPFLLQNTTPICIVSNIDTEDIMQAIRFHGLVLENVVTSEDAKSYKPRPEIFQMALERMNLLPQEVLHVGDTLFADISGAYNCGIDSFWLNRKKEKVSEDSLATYTGETLLDVLTILRMQ